MRIIAVLITLAYMSLGSFVATMMFGYVFFGPSPRDDLLWVVAVYSPAWFIGFGSFLVIVKRLATSLLLRIVSAIVLLLSVALGSMAVMFFIERSFDYPLAQGVYNTLYAGAFLVGICAAVSLMTCLRGQSLPHKS